MTAVVDAAAAAAVTVVADCAEEVLETLDDVLPSAAELLSMGF